MHPTYMQVPQALSHSNGDLIELLIHRKKTLALRSISHILYNHLYDYLKDHPHEVPNTELFAKFFCCSESDVASKLFFDDKARRVRGVARQLYDGGYVMEAGSLILHAQSFHQELLTLNDSIAYVKELFSNS